MNAYATSIVKSIPKMTTKMSRAFIKGLELGLVGEFKLDPL
jgi:hypothetical protein